MSGKKASVASPIPNEDENPLLSQIKEFLASTDPSKWQVGGEDYSQDLRFERPRDRYEQVLVMDIPGASLVLRESQPVTATYLRGGYSLIPAGISSYSIEVRDKIFNAERVVDPKYAANQKGKRCDVVATGEIAKVLFFQVRQSIQRYRKAMETEFERKASELYDALLMKVQDAPIDAWYKSDNSGVIQYSIEFDGFKVTIEQKREEIGVTHGIVISQGKLSITKPNTSLARSIFSQLEEMTQSTELVKLSELLNTFKLT